MILKSEFTIGNEFTGKKERYIGKINFWLTLRFMLIPSFISLLIIVFPFFTDLNLEIVKNIEMNIENKKKKVMLIKY